MGIVDSTTLRLARLTRPVLRELHLLVDSRTSARAPTWRCSSARLTTARESAECEIPAKWRFLGERAGTTPRPVVSLPDPRGVSQSPHKVRMTWLRAGHSVPGSCGGEAMMRRVCGGRRCSAWSYRRDRHRRAGEGVKQVRKRMLIIGLSALVAAVAAIMVAVQATAVPPDKPSIAVLTHAAFSGENFLEFGYLSASGTSGSPTTAPSASRTGTASPTQGRVSSSSTSKM